MFNYVLAGTVQKFGYIGDIDAGQSGEDVWIVEGAYTGFVAAAATTTIVSSSTDDTAEGTGARTVQVQGIVVTGGIWVDTQETVTLNGTTPVALANDYIRVYRMSLASVGSGTVNAGNIDVLHDAVILARIGTGYGQTLQAAYTIPDVLKNGADISAGRLMRWYASIGASQAAYATVALQTNTAGQGWRTRRLSAIGEGASLDERLLYGDVYASRTDIRIRIISNGVNNSAIAAGFDMEFY